MELLSKIPAGDIARKWDLHRAAMKLVNPANKRKYESSWSARDWPAPRRRPRCRSSATASPASASRTRRAGRTASPPRAASTPPRTTRTTATASGACSTTRSRAATSARGRPTSTAWRRSRCHIIDQCVAQGVPFAREYGGLLANRSFGGAQVSRTFYARGQTGQQLLLGAYQALSKEIARGGVAMHPRTEMLDVIVVNGRARGHRRARPGDRCDQHASGRCRGPGDRRLRQRLLPLDQRQGNATPRPSGAPTGAARLFANPCYTQIHPTCIPQSGRLPVEAHADVASRCATTVASGCRRQAGDHRAAR